MTGFLFILFFTIRGIYQIVYLLNHADEIIKLTSLEGLEREALWSAIITPLSHSSGSILDILLMVSCGLMALHGVLGIYYAVSTHYAAKDLGKKIIFYLQILSAFAAAVIIVALIIPSGGISVHSEVFYIISALIASAGAFHLGNGFFNACITLGISVSPGIKLVVKILSWIIAGISLLQIIVLVI